MNNLITIKHYVFPHELLIDKSKLESFGIECFTKDELTVQVHNFYSNAIGGIKLQIRESDLEKAKDVLKDLPDIKTDYPDSKLNCPNCESGNVKGIGLNGKISLILLMIIGLPIPIFSGKFHCFECHTQFKLNE